LAMEHGLMAATAPLEIGEARLAEEPEAVQEMIPGASVRAAGRWVRSGR